MNSVVVAGTLSVLIVSPVFVSIILTIYSDASLRLSQVHFDSSSLQTAGVGVVVGVGCALHVMGSLLAGLPIPQAFVAFTLHSYVSPGVPGNSNFVEGALMVPDLMILLVPVLRTVTLYSTALGDVSQVQVNVLSEQTAAGDGEMSKFSVVALPLRFCWFWISLVVKNTPISSTTTKRAMLAFFAGPDFLSIGSVLDLVYSKGIEF